MEYLPDKYVDDLLADEAGALVEGSFVGVEAEWWWERRLRDCPKRLMCGLDAGA